MIVWFRGLRSATALGAGMLTLSCVALPARAERTESQSHKLNSFLSGNGNIAFLAAGTLLPLLEDGSRGPERATRAIDALATSVMLSEGLKYVFNEKRPDSDKRNSFPSGHATAVFAVATVQARYHPEQAVYWYAGATAISVSRVSLHRHYIHDVLAGAALGYAVGSASIHHRFLTFQPEFAPGKRAYGLTMRFGF